MQMQHPKFENSSLSVHEEMGIIYRNDSKFSDRHAWANSVDPDQTAPRSGSTCLPFRLYLLDALLYIKATLFEF